MRLGIDFGTTRTVVTAVEQGNYPVCTFNVDGEAQEYVPSLIAVKDGEVRYGWDAAACLGDPSTSLVRSVKRLVGTLTPDAPVELAPGHTVPLIQLVTDFLAHVRQLVLTRSNLILSPDPPLEAMVACPANANSNQRFITMEAFQQAGFHILEVMNEPSAAAVEFVHRYLRNLGPKSPKQYVVTYDLGGGTFDTSVVGFAGRTYEVIAHAGLNRAGGDDFDEAILELALEKAGLPRASLDRQQETRLLEECRSRKEGLSPYTRKIVVDLQGIAPGETTVVLPTDELYARCGALIDRTIDCVDDVIQALARAGIDPEDGRSLAAVYLVGGSVAFPPVARRLRERFSRKVKNSPFPHAATAIGLAIAADPDAGVRLREAVSRHFGVWREDGPDKVFDSILPRGAALDDEGAVEVERRYQPVHNIGHLRYLECGSLSPEGEPAGDLALYSEVRFPYDPALESAPDLSAVPVTVRPELAAHEVRETYRYDRRGIIRVQIENRTTGFRREFALGRGQLPSTP
jgi:molecular chaperone DnaK (HSP70)